MTSKQQSTMLGSQRFRSQTDLTQQQQQQQQQNQQQQTNQQNNNNNNNIENNSDAEPEPFKKSTVDTLWRNFKVSLGSPEQCIEHLKKLVLHYSPNYDKWTIELQPEIHGMKMMEERIAATPLLDVGCVRFITRQLVTYVLSLGHSLTNEEVTTPEGLYLIVLVNILSRSPQNIPIIISENALTHPFQAARLAANKLSSFKDVNSESFQKWWPYLKILLGNCCQISSNFAHDRLSWQQSLKSNNVITASSSTSSSSINQQQQESNEDSQSQQQQQQQHIQASNTQQLFKLGIISILVDCLHFFNDLFQSIPQDSSTAPFRLLVIDTLGLLVYSSQTSTQVKLKEIDMKTLINCIGRRPNSQLNQIPEFNFQLRVVRVMKELVNNNMLNAKQFIQLKGMKAIEEFILWTTDCFQPTSNEITNEAANIYSETPGGAGGSDLSLGTNITTYDNINSVISSLKYATFSEKNHVKAPTPLKRNKVAQLAQLFQILSSFTFTPIPMSKLNVNSQSSSGSLFLHSNSQIGFGSIINQSSQNFTNNSILVINQPNSSNNNISPPNDYIAGSSNSIPTSPLTSTIILQQQPQQSPFSPQQQSNQPNQINSNIRDSSNHSSYSNLNLSQQFKDQANTPSSSTTTITSSSNTTSSSSSTSASTLTLNNTSPTASSLNISVGNWSSLSVASNLSSTALSASYQPQSSQNSTNYHHIGHSSSLNYSNHSSLSTSPGGGSGGLVHSGMDPHSLEQINPDKKYVNIYLIEMILEHLFKINKEQSNQSILHTIRTRYPELQLIVLEYLVKIVQESSETLDYLRRYFLWNLILSNYFYDSNLDLNNNDQQLNNTNNQSPTSSISNVNINNNSNNSINLDPETIKRSKYLFQGVKNNSLMLLQYFATHNQVDNYEEVMVLLEYIKNNISSPSKVFDICQLLINITKCNPKTIKSLIAMKIFTQLSEVVQQLLLVGEKIHDPAEMATYRRARNIVLCYLGQLIQNEEMSYHALVDTQLIKALFSVLTKAELKQYALTQIFHLMKLNPENESSLSEMYNIYISQLTKIREETSLDYGNELILSLLDGIRQVIKNNVKKQQLFKKFGVFIKIVTLVNVDDTKERLSTLCHSVLRTIIVLMANSIKIKKHFRNHIGYDTLKGLILKSEPVVSEITMNLLLDMIVDDEFDKEYNYVIQNSDATLLLFGLLTHFGEEQQHKILDTFTPIVIKCTTNQSVCCNCHLVYHLLEAMDSTKQPMSITAKILQLIESLGYHSVTVRELKKLFSLLKSEQGEKRPPITSVLLSTLQSITVSRNPGPQVYFDFDGKDSCIHLPTFDKWPFPKGFTFCTWVRIESFIDPTGTPDYKPRLFSFLNETGSGIEVLFIYQQIQVQVCSSAQQPPKVVLVNPPQFEERKWYFVCVVYSTNLFSSSEIRIYIDGQQRVKAPIQKAHGFDSMNNMCIGNNALVGQNERRCPLYGQMGAFNIFNESLSPSQIQSIFTLGPNFNTSFQDVEGGTKNSHTFDASLTSRLFLNYNCRALEGDLCLDNTLDMGGDRNYDATMVAINPCVSRDIKDIIYCLGGIKVLFPLIPQINTSQSDTPADTANLTIQVLGLFKDMLRGSEANQEEILRCQGLSILSHLLQLIPPESITLDALKIFKEMSTQISEPSLVDEVYQILLLDFRLWIKTAFPVQRNLLETIKNLIRNKFDQIKDIITVQTMVDIMANFYWYEWQDKKDSSLVTKEILAKRPCVSEITDLRIMIFDMLRKLLRTPSTNDVFTITRFLVTTLDSRQLVEMMQFIIDLSTNVTNYQVFFDELFEQGGTDIFLSLLRNVDENVRVAALQVLTKLHGMYGAIGGSGGSGSGSSSSNTSSSSASSSNPSNSSGTSSKNKRKPKIFQDSIIITRSLQLFPLTLLTYRYLMAFTLGFNFTPQSFNTSPQLEDLTADGCTEIVYPEVLGVILKLLLGAETIVLRQMILQEIKLIISINSQNRTSALLIDKWPEHLFSIINDTEIKNDTQYSNVTDLIIDIMKILSIHNFNDAKGYKTLENILATLRPFAERGVLDYHFLARTLFLNIVYSIKSEAHTLVNDHASHLIKSFKKASIFFDNLIHFMLIVEEFLFYTTKDDVNLSNSFTLIDCDNISMDQNTSTTSNQPSTPPPSPTLMPLPLSPIGGANGGSTSSISSTTFSPTGKTIHMNEKGEWEDFILTKELLDLVDTIKLINYNSSESSYNTSQSGKTANLYNSHQQRIILKITLESIKEACKKTDCMNLLMSNTMRLRMVLEKDFHSKSEESNLRCLFSLSHLIKATRNTMENNLTTQYQKILVPPMKEIIRKLKHGLVNYIVTKTLNSNNTFANISGSNNSNNNNNSGIGAGLNRLSVMMGGGNNTNSSNIEHEVSGWIAELSDSTRIVDFTTIAMMSVRWQYVCEYVDESVASQFVNEDKVVMMLVEKRKKKRNKHAQAIDDKEAEQFSMAEKKADADLKNIDRILYQPETERRSSALSKLERSTYEAASQWRRILRALTNERGPWGNIESVNNVHWKLDKTESTSRMRCKLKRNYKFDPHLNCAIDDSIGNNVDIHESVSSNGGSHRDNSISDLKVKPINNFTGDSLDNDWTLVNEYDNLQLDDDRSNQFNLGTAMASSGNTLTASSGIKEKTIYTTICDWVSPMNVKKGKLEVTTTHFTFTEQDDDPTASEIDAVEQQQKDSSSVKSKTWPCDMIKDVHLRRYLLRASALEIFMKDQTNVFFNFHGNDRNKAFSKINTARRIYLKDSSTTTLTPSETLKKATAEWQQRRISNFDYLMILNTIAGRTYNDLTQYPVFPWVISDYTSPVLDLSNPATFRDLSKPIGALNEKRLEVFKDRYESFDDPVIPKFYYGSHYSSAGIVLFYLIRMEPFTSFFLQMQGSRFDHADRMFDSIETAWVNTLTSSTDVKELIPEFFYNPEFLTNQNQFNFGVKQNGVPIGNVVLPPWAATPHDFIRLNRDALESEYVSMHLHEWIELIFGIKQRGRNAIAAYNVFYYLTYEGAVDIDSIEDETTRKATEAQINNFGQTPTQLFSKRPHPQRDPLNDHHQSIFKTPQNLQAYCLKISQRSLVYIFIPEIIQPMSYLLSDKVTVIDRSRMATSHKWFPNSQNDKSPFTLELEQSSNNKRRIGLPFANDVIISQNCFAVTGDGRFVMSCGHWDNSFKLSFVDSAKLIQSVVKHKDIVTCLAWASEPQYLVTGSKDTTLMVWNLITHKSGPPRFDNVPTHILYGHDDEITCVDVNVELDICVSGSKDGTCIIHNLRHGEYVRSIYLPRQSPVSICTISSQGHIVIYSQADLTIYLYSINGQFLKSVDTYERLHSIIISKDSEYIITGGDKGTVVIRTLYNLKFAHKLSFDQSIQSLAIGSDQKHLMVGLEDGRLLIIASSVGTQSKK